MKIDTQTLQVEITIAPQEGRKGGQRSSRTRGSKLPDPLRIPRITRLMALAIKFQDMVDRGEIRDYADLARLGYVTRARVTQIMNLLLLAPDIQEEVLLRPDGPMTAERDIRALTRVLDWQEQRRVWGRLKHRYEPRGRQS